MIIKISDIVQNWPKAVALIVLTLLLFWGYGCPPRVPSLTKSRVLITRPQLQIELDTIIATAEARMADLDQQEAFRDLIFKNVLVIGQTGTLNPIGIITLLTGLYGIARGTQDVKNRIKKTSK